MARVPAPRAGHHHSPELDGLVTGLALARWRPMMDAVKPVLSKVKVYASRHSRSDSRFIGEHLHAAAESHPEPDCHAQPDT